MPPTDEPILTPETTPTPTEPPAAEPTGSSKSSPIPTTDPAPLDPAADIAAREAALAIRERHVTAIELLQARNLPARLIDLIDLHSDETLQRSLDLAAAAATAAPPTPTAPPSELSPPSKSATYADFLNYLSATQHYTK